MKITSNSIVSMQHNTTKKYVSPDNNNQVQNNKQVYSGELSNRKKLGVGICSALGTAAAVMLLAKTDKSHKYSINPLKLFKGGFKDSYLMNTSYKSKEIITMGAGSILGGLAGGAIFDKKENMPAKYAEALTQMINVSLPIVFVESSIWASNKLSKAIMPAWENSKSVVKKVASKLPAVVGAMTGLMLGVYAGNKLSNKINDKLFDKKDNRPIKLTDFSAHVDDMCVAATLIDDKNVVTKGIQKIIPLALIVPGYETGIKTSL